MARAKASPKLANAAQALHSRGLTAAEIATVCHVNVRTVFRSLPTL